MIYFCCDSERRQAVLDHPVLNGIDFLEVVDTSAPPGSPRQRTLLVHFLKDAPLFAVENFEITGGVRIPQVGIEWVTPANAPDATLVSAAEAAFLSGLDAPQRVLALRTDSSGDHSLYTLHLVANSASLAPPAGIDPLLARVDFSFKVECASDFDCAPQRICPPEEAAEPAINYLAKDYHSFRRLMLERMAQIMPQWRERNAADLGIALVELLAYVGDRLSYAQDAVATEAYLFTARRRPSVRRHARLVDYFMHDGSNARTWVQLLIEGGPVTLNHNDTKFLTREPAAEEVRIPSTNAAAIFERPAQLRPTVFEPLHDQELFGEHNQILFYTWGESECCLPKGATRATLVDSMPNLQPGDILIFEEILGPRTGRQADADPSKRHAVRLVQVDPGLEDPLTEPPTEITEIRWAEEDALPFALCISARTEEAFGSLLVSPVSRALGNVVLADHGLSVEGRPLGRMPQPHLFLVPKTSSDRCDPAEREAVPPRFRPALEEAPLTQAVPYSAPPASARAALPTRPQDAQPSIQLEGTTPTGSQGWLAVRDLLNSGPGDPHFVVEIESDGTARLRFGDDRNGLRPASGTEFSASYRVGNGPSGNIGADALMHVVSDQGEIVGVRNPMPARGGLQPESVGEVRQAAPYAFRTQQRAVTPEDYASVSLRHPDVQRAAATFRWNGHGHTVFVTIDRFGGRPISEEFENEMLEFLEPFRMAGYDLEIDAPRFVPLEIELQVCVAPEHFRSDVRLAILDALSSRTLPDGQRGLFHPDNLTFGQDVYLSNLYAAVQALEGVESVSVRIFQRQGLSDPVPLETGVLPLGRLEIARLENDPDFPEHGVLKLALGGGK